MSRFTRTLIFSLVGGISFAFFFYLSFPYEILKEAIAAETSTATGLAVSIDEMKPRFPLGITVSKVSIANPAGARLHLEHVGASISILKLFIGKLGFDLDLIDKNAGYLELSVDFSIFELIRSTLAAPSRLVVNAKNFVINDLFAFAMKIQAESPSVNLMMKPLFSAFQFKGKLSADIDFTIDSVEPVNSEGYAKINFTQSMLIVADPNMNISDQVFNKAKIMAKLKDGRLVLDPSSGLSSSDLDIDLGGQISQRPNINLDLIIGLHLRKSLKDQFSWILDAAANKATDGKLQVHIGGELNDGPTINIL